MKLGTENKKKVYALAVLGVVAAISLYFNVFSDAIVPPRPPKSAAVTERERVAAEAPGTSGDTCPRSGVQFASAATPRVS